MQRHQINNKSSIRIQSVDGKIRRIVFIEINTKAQHFLEDKTGIIYGQGDFGSQTIEVLSSWFSKHRPEEDLSKKILLAAEMVIAQGIANMCGGWAAKDFDTMETLVYVPGEQDEYVVLISPIMENIRLTGTLQIHNGLLRVKKIGNGINDDELKSD